MIWSFLGTHGMGFRFSITVALAQSQWGSGLLCKALWVDDLIINAGSPAHLQTYSSIFGLRDPLLLI